jgi:hypothetical protein
MQTIPEKIIVDPGIWTQISRSMGWHISQIYYATTIFPKYLDFKYYKKWTIPGIIYICSKRQLDIFILVVKQKLFLMSLLQEDN